MKRNIVLIYKLLKRENVYFLVSFIVLSFASSLRHFWFQSSSWDLGIFDQAIYLISQGQEPYSTLLGFHILGDHGALILYPLGLLYKFFSTTYFLFFVQSFALTVSIYPLSRLSKKLNLSNQTTNASYLAFLLYPIIFNVNIFDFHPEVLAFPIVLDLFVSLKEKNLVPFWKLFLNIFLILSCKLSNSFLVFGFGIWLIYKNFLKIGALFISISLLWFFSIAFFLIPYFGGKEASILRQAGKFGINENLSIDLFSSIKIISQLISQLFSFSNLEYLILLILPIVYLLFNKKRLIIFTNLIPFIPLLFVNLISDSYPMKNLVNQYSLFIIPFLAVSIQESLSPELIQGVLNYPKWFQLKGYYFIIFWSVLTFLIFSRFTYYFGPFHSHFESSKARREAISLVKDVSSVLTTNDLVPHLSRRKYIKFINSEEEYNYDDFDEILLDRVKPGWKSNSEYVDNIYRQLKLNNNWGRIYEKNNIVLFVRLNSGMQPR
tara:strand:- start:1396 stop:2868 length:1473 start_codon:yes stop_codon:yes gene_type:complete